MRRLSLLVLAALVIACAPTTPPAAEPDPRVVPSALDMERALRIAGELVARQRLRRERGESSDNEPDMVVRSVLAVPGRHDLALAICEYDHCMCNGWATLVRIGWEIDEVAWFTGHQYSYVANVAFVPVADGLQVCVSFVTYRDKPAGISAARLNGDGSVHWLARAAEAEPHASR